jgi:pyrimidine-nucleoside phosphorylase
MEQPRGRAIGNWLEVREAVDCLKGVWIQDLMEVTLALGGSLLQLSGLSASLAEGREKCRQAIASGRAYETFLRGVKRQGGDTTVLERPEKIAAARVIERVRASRGGWVTGIATRAIGELAVELGAGRRRSDDVIDPRAGVSMEVRIGDQVQKGDLLATAHGGSRPGTLAAAGRLRMCITIGDEPVEPAPRIAGVVDAEGRSSGIALR